ncbi:DNA polymerase II large subunit [Natrialba swarupiae]|uniref:DNA polymerase II large subunit n=1 Tax=Natrialba swarupiae TaxID=2448032 RepID=A0A5D5ARX3_9EURY|nr:DNA polymerase II large subunit [Natrialba swarupiae]TYT63783.1 DNA polymerase II large subunit [Natrialba swarupiae]
MRTEDERYFERIESQLDEALDVAERAKERGGDPEPEVEIPVAQDMADRVENILGIDGVAERVRELEGEMSREEAALELAKDFAEGRVGDYETKAGKVEGAVRTAVALLTEGVVAAPIEGIDKVEILENGDGTEFVNVYYAGPIRSAGGTAQALSVLVADYTRALVGIDQYKARDEEIERYAEEIALYDKETGLQYTPKDKETKFIAKHLPIMLDGEATGDEEVSGFRDLERVDTNSARGGMCLVAAEGIALKAPKIQRYTSQLDEIDWPWLQDLIDGNYGDETADADADEDGEPDTADDDDGEEDEVADDDDAEESTGPPRPEPSKKFLRDLIAGRPVFSHPSAEGGFRLRYGRARNHGFATGGIHPATMHLVDDFLATGTQIKTERPGKAHGIIPVDSIDGPTVKLANGDVRRIDDPEEALEIRNGVEKILDTGEYLVNYGEFVENNHPLSPASYVYEWWIQDLDAAGADVQALKDDPRIDLEFPDPAEALEWALEYDAPLHPQYTYLWHDLSVDAFCALSDAVSDGWVEGDPDEGTLVLEYAEATLEALETIIVEHRQRPDEGRIELDEWRPFVRTVGCEPRRTVADGAAVDHDSRERQPSIELERTWTVDGLSERARTWGHETDGDNAIEAVNEVAPFAVRERSPTRVGNRMGRPEKSERRDLSPPVHTLFPIGEAGGAQRNVADAASHTETMSDTPGVVELQIGRQRCESCGTETFENRCPDCGDRTVPDYRCPDCEQVIEPDEAGRVECGHCGVEATCVETREVDVHGEYRDALESVGERENAFEILKGVKGLTSANKIPEPMEKGILRAKHDVSAFKDGTVRYDMTDLPVTSVRASELDVDVGQLQALGYEEDIHGEALVHEDQLVELNVQDVVLSDGAAEHMMQTADFIDDLLAQYYGLDPFYELEDRQDLVGELVFGMAPHTSAATVGRVIGFTSAAVGYAHPYFHAAKRRNCFHPETTIRYADESGTEHEASIETFVESQLTDPREDDFGVLVQDLEGFVTVPSIDDDGRHVTRQVEAVSKHPAPDHLIRVETRSGRSLTVTPDHTMVVWNDGLERVVASELEAGDEIPTPARADSASDSGVRAEGVTDGGRPEVDIVERTEIVPSDVEYTYCLTVSDTHTLVANGLHTAQCDGDEDCVMLLMDGLLNFSRSYLPDQRGGSVAEDSRLIAFDPDGNLRFMTFDEFWEELDVPIEIDGKFRKKTAALEGWTTYAFDDDHEAAPKPIEKAIRYEADDDEELLRISTQFGRELEITTDHSLFRYDDGIEEVAGSDLEEGDLIVAPRNLDVEPVDTTIDALDCIEEPYVLLDDEHEEWLTTVWDAAERGGDTRVAFDGGLSYRLSKKKVCRSTLEEIKSEHGETTLPDTCLVGWKGSSDCIDRHIDIDEDLAWLLGMFVAEGSLSGTRPAIHNADEELVDRVVDATKASIGCEPSVRWSNKAYEVAFPTVFFDVLHELGFEDHDSYNSSEKIVPECILRAERNIVLAFLRGFIAGDGSESSDDNHTSISFHTTSEDVKDGIVFLCHRLGLVANVSRRERDASRQPIYTVSVSGGASDNPLKRILDGEDSYRPKSLVVTIPAELMEIREMAIDGVKQLVPKYLKRRDNISLEKLEEIVDELDGRDLPEEAEAKLEEIRPLVDGDLSYLRITSIERVDYDGYLYDLQVGGDPIFTANWLYAHNSMDAPLVMSSRIDPSEIDDEAHNMDIVSEYPREFYLATLEQADPGEVDVQIAEDTLGTDEEYAGFEHTHDTTDIAMGPDLSAYKTLGSMMDKMDAQLELARKLEAVDETDVAERVIEYHFLPDLIGNLRAFSRQETRCLDCGEKFRRMPLTGDCRECGGRVNLTVHKGSVNKYMQTAINVAEEYDCRDYTKQRLEVLEKSLESIFENDKNKQSGIEDFM